MRIKLFALLLVVLAVLATAFYFGGLGSKACGACPLVPFSDASTQAPLACCPPLWTCDILAECGAEEGCYCRFPDAQWAGIGTGDLFNPSQGESCIAFAFANCVYVKIRNSNGTVIRSKMACCPQGGCGPSGN